MKTILFLILSFSAPSEYEIIRAAAIRNNCDDLAILLAIRRAENGAPGKEFGIVHPKAWGTNLSTQAGWAACTVRNQRKRHAGDNCGMDFIACLARRYCPIGAENDPAGLNKNWERNVRYWLEGERL